LKFQLYILWNISISVNGANQTTNDDKITYIEEENNITELFNNEIKNSYEMFDGLSNISFY